VGEKGLGISYPIGKPTNRKGGYTEALVMVFSLLEEERVKWQKIGMRAKGYCLYRGGIKDIGERTNMH